MLSPLQHFKTHDPHFKIFHELMAFKVQEILLVSSPYDAYIMEEDGSLASRIIHEYHGLNLSRPPRITWVPSADQGLDLLSDSHFDLVVTMPHLGGMDGCAFACRVKRLYPLTPVLLLAHSARDAIIMGDKLKASCFDDSYIWCCDSDILLAIVKNTEDKINAARDTQKAMVRVILLVEDSPVYRSALLPMLYNEVVRQTQAVLDEGLNEQHRMLKMRARPKILTASCYEEAIDLFREYQPYMFCVMSDVRFPRAGKLEDRAGYDLLETIRETIPDLPLLMLSTDESNRELAKKIPAVFLDKNTEAMREELHNFFLNYLGFGDFVFRSPDGLEISRAARLRDFELCLQKIPDDSLLYHAHCNHFSNWIMARAEIVLAARLHKDHFKTITNTRKLREYLINEVHTLRELRQQGVVAQFSARNFDNNITEFSRMGDGSLGGKARGIAFMSSLLAQAREDKKLFSERKIIIPQTCVITSQGFTDFIQLNNLHLHDDLSDEEIEQQFLRGHLPDWLLKDLKAYLKKIHYPLSVRSSGLLEDAQFRPYAGLYQTYMLDNAAADLTTRLDQLVQAVKLVYASTWFENPRAFSRSVGQTRHDSMAVIIQQLVGSYYKDNFYPAVSGVAQSYNYYPIAPMRSQDGIAHLALGFGKTVVEGEQSLRFSPAFPRHLPQFSTVDDMLVNSQRQFYCMDSSPTAEFIHKNSNLILRTVQDAFDEYPIRYLSSTYIPEEHRIRDGDFPGTKIITFASLLKYNTYPLPEILQRLLSMGRKGMGCEVEIEFAVDIPSPSEKPVFYFLQIRPIVTNSETQKVEISTREIKSSFLYSAHALGQGLYDRMRDIVFVPPERFDKTFTREIGREIGTINRKLQNLKRPYLLIGPGRWGTADRWLGIPVQWADISAVGAIAEVQDGTLVAEASQGTHFFQNITSLGIPYLLVKDSPESGTTAIDWNRLNSLPVEQKSKFVTHVSLKKPIILKVDGINSQAAAFFSPKKS